MKKLLLETSFSKIYMIVMIIITLLILGGYFSYAMFTVSKEKSNAITIVTGNLEYKLLVDGEETNTLTVESNTVKDFTVTLSNPNNRIARFNFYYVGELNPYTKTGYIMSDGMNPTPVSTGINLEKVKTVGSSNTYTIRVINNSSKSTTITLGVSVGLDYNDLTLPENGHLFEEITHKGEVGEVVIDDISKDSLYDDGTDTFITGEYPNNYIWYSGKLWRAVSVNNDAKTVKLVTQWNISAIPYDDDSSTFEGSHMEEWLNDTTLDGFLGNLRDYERFIKLDSKWNATMMTDASKPPSTTIVEDTVGLLSAYEYAMSYTGTDAANGYLNNGLSWHSITPQSYGNILYIETDGSLRFHYYAYAMGIRPVINLKKSVKIISGNGTVDNPYRLLGDNDTNLSGTLLNARYSGEYIRFGSGENSLYRIVSHENGTGTKITSAESLKENGNYIMLRFGDSANYSISNTIGNFLNGEYLTKFVSSNYIDMIEDNTTWYLGTVGSGANYKLAKYADITGITLTSNTTMTKVGLLRLGELMAGQFDRYLLSSGDETNLTKIYWLLTKYDQNRVWHMDTSGYAYDGNPINSTSIKPSLNLKANVIITSGDGTKENPFNLELAS